jgi:hypothetical protein
MPHFVDVLTGASVVGSNHSLKSCPDIIALAHQTAALYARQHGAHVTEVDGCPGCAGILRPAYLGPGEDIFKVPGLQWIPAANGTR